MATAWDLAKVFQTMTAKGRRDAVLYMKIIELFEELSAEDRLTALIHLEHIHVVKSPAEEVTSE